MYKIIKQCRICKNDILLPILNLGKQPPANSFLKKRKNILTIPLELVFCSKCKTAQLSATVNPGYLFRNYFWVTSTSFLIKKYAKKFCINLLKKIKNKKRYFVFEIASNDGLFLKEFKSRGHKILGVDPAKNIANLANKNGINTIAAFFSYQEAKKILLSNGKADIIYARNVLPHVANPHSIVNGISKLVSDTGIVAIEFHYSKIIINKIHYDSIYHEHIFYFSILTLTNLFKIYNLYAFDYDVSYVSGGSLVIYFSKSKKKYSNRFKKIINLEKKDKINTYQKWKSFSKNSIVHATKFKQILKKISSKVNVIGYGASARSSTLLNFCSLNYKDLSKIIDKNLLKQKHFTPGTLIEIISIKEFKKLIKNIGCIVILAWNFSTEVVNELRRVGYKKKIIIPLPKIKLLK